MEPAWRRSQDRGHRIVHEFTFKIVGFRPPAPQIGRHTTLRPPPARPAAPARCAPRGTGRALLWLRDGAIFALSAWVEFHGEPLGCLQPLEHAAGALRQRLARVGGQRAVAAAPAVFASGPPTILCRYVLKSTR